MIIQSASYLISSPDYTKCPKPDRPEYAFIGRSNVGKSSVINMLCDNHKLAKTSGSPGKTQMINHFDIKSLPSPGSEGGKAASPTTGGKGSYSPPSHRDGRVDAWYLVDLPGYGFAKVSQSQRKSWEKMIEDYLRKRENLLTVFVLIDSRHSPQKLDLDFVNQLGEWEIPFSLVFTKADKETQKEVSKNVKAFLDAMRETWQFLPRHFVTSAIKKMGRDKMLQFIDECNVEFNAAGKEERS
ncbi:YihA family ribosome biogenesis GTP-binding protein [Niastella caeni]|uniref:Probable GTP-binding protein EngB n=1 Tax=Niastella caeni TaxID=2569763 RepID=A0A4S8HEL1_9BACT|nr:GTP-binding protein [Niastella caeni]THU33508.1 YihA family ribosome biogenesis GTP-binding protein [Niastella caeni]